MSEMDEKEKLNGIDLFYAEEQTYDEAVLQEAQESSFAQVKRFALPKDGKKDVRILPLRPGKERKGWEYPLREFFMKIALLDEKGKQKTNKNGTKLFATVPIVDATMVFPGLKNDPLKTYVKLAVKECGELNLTEIAEDIESNAFDGGLKYDYKRVCLIYDDSDENKEIQMLKLSYSQFKTIEEIKKDDWARAIKDNPKAGCPLSSPKSGHLLNISGSKKGKKQEYAFKLLGNDRDIRPLTEADATKLLNTPHLDELLYRYTRYHFTALIEFLNQKDAEYGLSVMKSDEMNAVLDEVEDFLPATDTSKFTSDVKAADDDDDDSDGDDEEITIDSLEDDYNAFVKSDQEDDSEDGKELKAKMKEFINAEKLDVTVTRKTSLETIWEMINEALDYDSGDKNNEPDPEDKSEKNDKEDSKEEDDNDNRNDRSDRSSRSERSSRRSEDRGDRSSRSGRGDRASRR